MMVEHYKVPLPFIMGTVYLVGPRTINSPLWAFVDWGDQPELDGVNGRGLGTRFEVVGAGERSAC